jgi:hypothetical protein
MVDQSTKTFTTGYKIVTAGVTNRKKFLPIDLDHWVAKFIISVAYLNVPHLAEKLISKVLKLDVQIKYL